MRRMITAAILLVAAIAVMPSQSAMAAPTCHGKVATVWDHNPGGHTILGTRNPDVIQAGGGNDAVIGRRGDDLICGGSGNDLIDGGKGLDPVYAGTGTDACAAPTADEHQVHHGCEFHLTPPPPNPGPPPSAASIRSATKLTGSDVARGGGAAYHDAGSPNCAQNVIDLGNVNAAGAYTDPSYVAFRPGFWEYRNGWVFRGYNDWQVYQFSYAGGATYRLPAGSVGADSGYWFVGYEWYWWNGSSWVNEDFTFATDYSWEGVGGFTFCIT